MIVGFTRGPPAVMTPTMLTAACALAHGSMNPISALFAALPLDKLDRMALTSKLGEIGKQGA